MRSIRFGCVALLVVLVVAGSPRHATAQIAVTPADVQRLQEYIGDASREIGRLRFRDAALAAALNADLDDARDEAIYLKVKLRKREPVVRGEYLDLRDRIDTIRGRAAGDSFARPQPRYAPLPAPPPPPPPLPAPLPPVARELPPARGAGALTDLPVGFEFDVRLQNPISSATAQVEDRFEATTTADLVEGGRLIVPAGSVLRGLVSSVNKAGRIDRKGSLTVAFDRVTIEDRAYPIRATVTQAIESGLKGEAAKVGAGAGVGAIVGALLGGGKGAVVGGLIGGGGTVAATEGKDVELPPGTVLRVRLDSGLSLR